MHTLTKTTLAKTELTINFYVVSQQRNLSLFNATEVFCSLQLCTLLS